MAWNEYQRQAIFKRDQNILVSAAAGSGKTAVLVERIKQLVISDGVDIEEILVVTFSNAAASEMRQRLVLSLTDEIEKGGDNQAFLRSQLNRIGRANISTFHAFAMEIIRRYFYLIDVEPNFHICDEPYKIILQSAAMDELFEALFLSKDAEFIAFLSKYASSKNENDVRSMILEVHKFIQSIPDSFHWLEEKVQELARGEEAFLAGSLYAEIRLEIEMALGDAIKCFQKAEHLVSKASVASLRAKCLKDLAAMEDLMTCFTTQPFNDFAVAAKSVKFETFRASKEDEANFTAIKESIKASRDKGKGLIRDLVDRYLGSSLEDAIAQIQKTHGDGRFLYSLVDGFDKLYKQKKREKGLIDFNDIEHYALDILSNDAAAKEYREKFRHIFIDEYQDSNLVQETLIKRIKRENNLFMVGDVKQSIYKFRLAEPELFMKKYDAYKAENNDQGHKIDLNMNYRSKGGIIGTINAIFGVLMQRKTCSIDYDVAAALNKGLDYQGELDYPVKLYLAESKAASGEEDDEINELKKAEIEAKLAAQIIKDCLGKPIYDEKLDQVRPIVYRDMVILFRSAKGYAEVYGDMLQKENIPNFVDIGDGYFDTMEVAVFLNLLRIIDNKRQDIPLLSVLRSPIFGFTPEELSTIRIHKQKTSYFSAFESYEQNFKDTSLGAKCGKTLERLAEWKAFAALLPLEELLWKLIRETGYYDYIGAIPGGSQRQANLKALVDKASQFQSAHMKGLFGFINYVELLKKDKVNTSQIRMIGENDDVVRIMTVHKSKGLEFPVVLVCGLGKKFNRTASSFKVTLHKSTGMGLRYVDVENGCYTKTLTQTLIDQQRNREATAEEIRILYVAMTRARDLLILLGSVSDAGQALSRLDMRDETDIPSINNALDWILLAQKGSPLPISTYDRSSVGSIERKSKGNRNLIQNSLEYGFSEKLDESILEDVSNRLSWRYPFSGALSYRSKMSVSDIVKAQKSMFKSVTTPKFRDDQRHFTSAEKGTLLHRILEEIDFNQTVDEHIIKRQVSEMIEKEILTQEQADSMDIQMLVNFFRSDIGIRASKASKVYKEVPFNLAKDMTSILDLPPEFAAEKIILQGTIDCYFLEGSDYILLDYKSDFIGGEDTDARISQLISQYKPQISLYKEALEKIRGIKVKEVYFFFLFIGREIRVDC